MSKLKHTSEDNCPACRAIREKAVQILKAFEASVEQLPAERMQTLARSPQRVHDTLDSLKVLAWVLDQYGTSDADMQRIKAVQIVEKAFSQMVAAVQLVGKGKIEHEHRE